LAAESVACDHQIAVSELLFIRGSFFRKGEDLVMRYRWIAGMLAACIFGAAMAQDESMDALKKDAIDRLSAAQDTTLSIDIGRVYVKQTALLTAREVLTLKGRAAGLSMQQWNLETPEWQDAERELTAGLDELIRVGVANPAWLKAAWAQLSSQLLNAEEADEIAVHFRTEGGALQRRVIEWFVGELTLQYYTFTNRLKYGVPGSESEMRDLQVTTYEIQSHFEPIYDLTDYPNTMRFASRDPGVKFMKMMVTSGVHVIHTHLEKVADQARETIRARAALADPHIARARQRLAARPEK
jgi:hypothetical protein